MPGVLVAAEEFFAQAQGVPQGADDRDVAARLALRRHRRRPQLHQRLSLLADPEAHPQPFALPGRSDR